MLTSIDVKFMHIFDSAQGCSAPQIFCKQQMSTFELFSCCSCHVFSYFFAQFLLLKRVKCRPFLFSQPKQPQPRPQVFSVNGALTCKEAALLTSSVDQSQNSSKFGHQQLVVVNYACAFIANQSRGNVLSLLYGQPKCILKRLQSVLNSAARLIHLTSRYEHVTPLLIQLHWHQLNKANFQNCSNYI